MPIRRAVEADPHARAGDPSGHQQGISPARRRRQSEEQISFFTVPDVAEHLGVSARTVRRWIEGQQLVAHHLGRAVRISEQDLRAFLAARRGI
jgi:excisionase family DNA binding protein